MTAASLAPQQAAGAGATCTGAGNQLIGYKTSRTVTNTGTAADIEFSNPDLCGDDDTGGSASVAWSMIQAQSATYPSNSLADGYAQAGYGQFAYDQRAISTFSQYTKKCKATLSCTNGETVTQYDPANPASALTYRAYWDSADGLLHMKASTLQLDVSTYNPSSDWQNDWQSQYAAETLHLATDVVGVDADRTAFTKLKSRSATTGDWNFISSSVLQITSGSGRYHKSTLYSVAGGYGFKVWTDPL